MKILGGDVRLMNLVVNSPRTVVDNKRIRNLVQREKTTLKQTDSEEIDNTKFINEFVLLMATIANSEKKINDKHFG